MLYYFILKKTKLALAYGCNLLGLCLVWREMKEKKIREKVSFYFGRKFKRKESGLKAEEIWLRSFSLFFFSLSYPKENKRKYYLVLLPYHMILFLFIIFFCSFLLEPNKENPIFLLFPYPYLLLSFIFHKTKHSPGLSPSKAPWASKIGRGSRHRHDKVHNRLDRIINHKTRVQQQCFYPKILKSAKIIYGIQVITD